MTSKEPSSVGSIAETILATLEEERAKTAGYIRLAGGGIPFLAKHYPGLLAGHPDVVKEEALTGYTVEWYRQAETRSGRCSRCPEHGGACVPAGNTEFRAGQQAYWDDGMLKLRQCDKWETYDLVLRLIRSGVPNRLAVNASHELASPIEADFANHPQGKTLEIMGDNIVLKRELALRALWTLYASRSRAWGRYVLCSSLIEKAKDFYSDRGEDPWEDLLKCPILVLDSLPSSGVPEWWAQRVGLLIYERWAALRCTIIVTEFNQSIDETYPVVMQIFGKDRIVVDASRKS